MCEIHSKAEHQIRMEMYAQHWSQPSLVPETEGGTAVKRVWHIRQSRPDSGLGIQVKVLEISQDVACPLGSGRGLNARLKRLEKMSFMITKEDLK